VSSRDSGRFNPQLALWLAVGLCSFVIVLGFLAFRAVREWERTATLLADRHAQESADLLALALTRDMRGVQESILSSQDWSDSMEDDSFDLSTVVASAFARFPYPEVFFAWNGGEAATSVQFYARPDRLPHWMHQQPSGRALPVVLGTAPTVGDGLFQRVHQDINDHRRFSVFDFPIGGHQYQVVARLTYRDAYRQQPYLVFGFVVNMDWSREQYFPLVAKQVSRILRPDSSLVFSLFPEGETERHAPAGGIPEGRRVIPMAFFDPLLIAVDPPKDLRLEQWTLQARLANDMTVVSARVGARRTLLVVALGGLGFALGLVLTVTLTRSHARLAQLRADFVSTVTHELKTPIATIRAAGDTLASGRLTDGETSRRYAKLMVDESKHLTRLLDNLLAYARIADTTEVYSFSPIEVDALVNHALHNARSRLESSGFAVVVDIPPDIPMVHADWTAIGLALENLVDNSIRYSKDEKSLAITARSEGEFVRIQVSDRGIGIPADEIRHATRRFFRGRSTPSGGSGLGLAIVERIVTDHKGSLKISSVVGEGTTAEITLPISSARHP
jgi:signal transduction histidine kinase